MQLPHLLCIWFYNSGISFTSLICNDTMFQSQNRLGGKELGRDLRRSTSLLKAGLPPKFGQVAQGLFSQIFSVTTDGDSTVILGKDHQCLVTRSKKFNPEKTSLRRFQFKSCSQTTFRQQQSTVRSLDRLLSLRQNRASSASPFISCVPALSLSQQLFF